MPQGAHKTQTYNINHPSSNHIYTKSKPNHIHHNHASSVTHTHTRNTSYLQLHPHTHHIVTPGFVDRPRRSECTAGQIDGEAGWWNTSGNIGLPSLERVMGVSRQQQTTTYVEHLYLIAGIAPPDTRRDVLQMFISNV